MLRELNRDVPPREEALPALELFETSVVARAVCGGGQGPTVAWCPTLHGCWFVELYAAPMPDRRISTPPPPTDRQSGCGAG